MAHRYTMSEGLSVLRAFNDNKGSGPVTDVIQAADLDGATVTEAVHNMGARFPLATVTLTQCLGNSGAEKLIAMLPSSYSVRKLDAALKSGNPDATPEDETEAPKSVAPAAKERRQRTPASDVKVDTSEIDAILNEV